jgi:HEAT repeat protein
MFKTSPWFSIVFTAVMIGNSLVPMAVASEWNSQKGIRGSKARNKDSLRYSGRYPMLFTQGGTNARSASDLIPFLLDDSAEIREKAFNDLSQLGVGVAVPALTGALQNSDWQVRVIAAYSLGRLGPEASAAVPALITSLQDKNVVQVENVNVKFSAAKALGKINSDQAISPLINALKDPDENVRFAAVSALLQLVPKVQGDNLVTFVKFLQNGNPMPVYPNFSKADTLKPESRLAIPAYIEALGNSNWFIRNQAANALAKLKVDSISIINNTLWMPTDAESGFGIITNPEDGFMRGVFTDTFLRTNSDHLIEIIKSSKDPNIRTQAAKALGMLKDKKAIPSLINALQNEMDLDTAKEIVTALGRIRAEEAVPAILTTLQKVSSRQPDNGIGIEALEQIGTQEAIAGLIAAFPKEKMYFIVSATIRKIVKGDTTPEESISLLSNILQSGDIDAITQIIDPPELASNNPVYLSALRASLQQLGIEKVVYLLRPILLKEAKPDEEREINADTGVINADTGVISADTGVISADTGVINDLTPTYNRLAAAKALSIIGSDAVPVIITSFSEAEAFAVFADVALFEDIWNITVDTPTKYLAKNVVNQVSPKLISKSNAAVRDEIASILSDINNPKKAVPYSTKELQNWIKTLQRNPDGIERLEDEDEREGERIEAVQALGQIGSSEAVPSLIKSLKDKSYIVRLIAAEALGKIKAQAAIPALIESLKDKAWTVRLEAATALKSIGTEAVPPLITVLNSNRGNSSAIQTALKNKNADHRRSAAYVLWQMGSLANQAKNDLMAVVKNENDNLDVRWMAATALENMGQDMDRFFTDNNLTNPQNFIPAQCPNDTWDIEVNSKVYLDRFYKERTVDTNELIYAGRCIYGDLGGGGGTIAGFYETLKALLNRR